MKKLLTFLLTAAIFINTCGYVLIYWNLKPVYKKNMFVKINSGEAKHLLEEIVADKYEIGTASLLRVEKHEIKYHGRMYDIVKEYEKDGKIHFVCISDENEDRLNNYFEENYENNVDKKADKNPLKNIFKLGISFAVMEDSYTLKNYYHPDEYSEGKIISSINYIFEIPTPPPQFS